MKAKVFTQDGKAKGDFELPESVFGQEMNEHLVHLVITGLLANQRQGTANAKGRSEVSGSGKKPWRQKGTGRARAGTNTSPVWVRGGKAFGPEPRDFSRTIPQKMRRKALQSVLSARASEEKVFIVDELSVEEPRTRAIADLLANMKLNGRKNLLLLEKGDRGTYLSARNIKNLQIKPVTDVNAYDVLNSENLIFGAEKLIKQLEEVVVS